MARPPSSFSWITPAALLLGACGENGVPTQPEPGQEALSDVPALALAPDTWTPMSPSSPAPPFPGARAEGYVAGMARNAAGQTVVYVFGGGDVDEQVFSIPTFAYNVATNTWATTRGGIEGMHTNGVGTIGGRLYVTGGRTEGEFFEFFKTTWAYNPATDRMTRKADLPKSIANGVTGVISGKLYVLAGACSMEADIPGNCLPDGVDRQLYRYDPSTNTWAARRKSPREHTGGAGGVINGKFYVVGRFSTSTQSRADLDVYDPRTNTWKTLAPMPAGGDGRLVAAVLRNKLHVLAAKSLGGGAVAVSHYVYNPVNNTWQKRASPPAGGELVQVTLNDRGHLLLVHHPFSGGQTYLYTP